MDDQTRRQQAAAALTDDLTVSWPVADNVINLVNRATEEVEIGSAEITWFRDASGAVSYGIEVDGPDGPIDDPIWVADQFRSIADQLVATGYDGVDTIGEEP